MRLASDLRVLYHLALARGRGADHAARLEAFYGPQAGDYDGFRERLLHGRAELFAAIEPPRGGLWIDLGGGTGRNVEYLGDRLAGLRRLEVVDLCPSLLAAARDRIERRGWTNVRAVEADAATYRPADGPADVVTFSYALTMIPDWFRALEQARALLRPGGLIGVVDFYVARKWPEPGLARHSAARRAFWPAWFALDNVFPSPDHLPWLRSRFEPIHLHEGAGKVPYLPFLRAPYYRFLGRKPLGSPDSGR